MNQIELKKQASAFLRKHFDMELEIPIRISNRMSVTFGLFRYNNKSKQSKDIAISGNFIRHNDRERILDVLYHECVHYALFEKGLPHSDGDQTFKDTVDRLGISRTRTYRYKGKAYVYECKKCRITYKKRMKGYEKRYICGYCDGRFRNIGTVEIGNSEPVKA